LSRKSLGRIRVEDLARGGLHTTFRRFNLRSLFKALPTTPGGLLVGRNYAHHAWLLVASDFKLNHYLLI
jgi:hypothetical protein